jgi:hypothetical protein
VKIGEDTCIKTGDAVQAIMKSQIDRLNQAWTHADGDLAISIAMKIGAATEDGGITVDGTFTYTVEKAKLPFHFKVNEGQGPLFKEDRKETAGINEPPTDLQKQVAEDLHKIAEAADRALGPVPAALTEGEVVDVEFVEPHWQLCENTDCPSFDLTDHGGACTAYRDEEAKADWILLLKNGEGLYLKTAQCLAERRSMVVGDEATP